MHAVIHVWLHAYTHICMHEIIHTCMHKSAYILHTYTYMHTWKLMQDLCRDKLIAVCLNVFIHTYTHIHSLISAAHTCLSQNIHNFRISYFENFLI